MRIGSFEIKTQRLVRKTIAEQVSEHLASQEVREIVARMARSEVKNYLALLAEENDLPFSDPAAFLAQVRTRLAAALLVERMNKEHGITLEDLERRHVLDDPTFNPFRFGGYANHPEQREYDAEPGPFEIIKNVKLNPIPGDEFDLERDFEEVGPPTLTPEQQNMVNLNKTGFVSDEELDEANIQRGEG